MAAAFDEAIVPDGPFPAREFRTLVSVFTYSKAPQVRLEALHHFLECWLPDYTWHLWMRDAEESWTTGRQPSNEVAAQQPVYSESFHIDDQKVHLQGWADDHGRTSYTIVDHSELTPFCQFLLHLLLTYPNYLSDEEASARMQDLESSRLELFSDTINSLSERLNSSIRLWKELPDLLYTSAAFLNAQRGFIALRVDDSVGLETFGIADDERDTLEKHLKLRADDSLNNYWKQHDEVRLERIETDDEVVGWIGFAGKDTLIEDEQATFTPLDDRMIKTLANGMKVALSKLLYILSQERQLEQYRVIMDTINTAILTTDNDLIVTRANPKAAELLSRPLDQLQGSPLFEAIPKNGPLAEFIKQAIEQHDKAAVEMVPISARDDRSLNVYYSPLKNGDSRIRERGHLFTMEEVTELRKLRDSFSTYVSDRVLKMVQQQEHRMRLGGQRKECIVLFCDIRGFTKWSEGTDAERVVETLNQYFTLMMEAVTEHGGEIDKIIGDELMAVYYPHREETLNDLVDNVIRTTQQMLRSLKMLNELREEQGAPPVSFGVGVNAGEVICGNIGSFKRMDYTVIGDTVNVASRLCDAATTNQVLVSDSVRQLLDPVDEDHIKDLGSVRIKGKDRPLSIYELQLKE
jgi:class 3 adenylate cyclase/PAS domain-containing protein